MKEVLKERLRGVASPVQGKNLVREYLQARILHSMQRSGGMIPLAFHGGTCLRFLFSLHRYSEDLDFALEGNSEKYDLEACLKAVRRDLSNEGYSVEIKLSQKRILHSAFIRFPGLLWELLLSSHRQQSISVKIEVDTRPPQGAVLQITIVRREIFVRVQHHDRASLLSGKLHALLQRPFLKGRDVYDLIWYLSDPNWPAPNLVLLNNALRQTGWKGRELGENTWKKAVARRIFPLSWDRVAQDVAPFLEDPQDAKLLTKENLRRLLQD